MVSNGGFAGVQFDNLKTRSEDLMRPAENHFHENNNFRENNHFAREGNFAQQDHFRQDNNFARQDNFRQDNHFAQQDNNVSARSTPYENPYGANPEPETPPTVGPCL